MYAIIDCNSFYASCERVFAPHLRNKPVVVLSNNDGCVIARTSEAKKLGIPMGAEYFKYKEYMEKNNIKVFSSNYPLYADMSERMINTISEIVPEIEVYSIDEAFAKLSGLPEKDYRKIGLEIKNRVYKYTGLPVSVGIAPAKTLAKVANFYAKRYPKFSNVLVLDNPTTIDQALGLLDVSEIWGIGYRYSKFLKNNNIKSALDLKNAPEAWIKKHLKVTGLRTQKELKGVSCIPLETVQPDKKQILVSRSFKNAVTDINEMKKAVSTFITIAALKMRKQHSNASILGVFVNSGRFAQARRPSEDCFKTAVLQTPSNNTFELIKIACNLVDSIFYSGYKYKKAGVFFSGLCPESGVQFSFFDTFDRDKFSKVVKTIDFLNDKYGKNTVLFAVQGEQIKLSTQEMLSPEYTTKWSDIIEVS